MPEAQESLPLNSVRAFVVIAREKSVTRAAVVLGVAQSAVSRHLAVLEDYLGSKLIQRQGRNSELTEFGRLFASAVSEPLDTIYFTAQRMKRRRQTDLNRILVRTSLPTFASTLLIPNIQAFSSEAGGAVVDVVTTLSQPTSADNFDVLITRDLALAEPSDRWVLLNEDLVCVGSPRQVAGKAIDIVTRIPIVSITSRPDTLPTWLRGMDIRPGDIKMGARYDHHYLALPAIAHGKSLLVTPEVLVRDLIQQGLLEVVTGTRTPSGMQYHAHAVDRSQNLDLARMFCRWLVRLCREDPVKPKSPSVASK
ncbi:LysR family transcriptional regulator [Mesorhizobium loti]|uniref:LysR family transcriptional regulator n=1 Tax=Rhizobium loti TaxID=381 RepID=A0A117N3D4_RHILI|nr:LysR family transcriptional regulator [Mesorhizobium loti]